MGANNDEVYKGLLGMSDAQLWVLKAEKVI